MARRQLRVIVDDAGRLEVIDPGFDTLAVTRIIDPRFRPERAPLPGFVSPRFLRARSEGAGLATHEVTRLTVSELERAHEGMLAMDSRPRVSSGQASVLDLKVELATRYMSSCLLCAHRCGVDRHAGERGACGLGPDANVYEHFIHVAEEAPINPALVISLAGCGLRCRFCQQWQALAPRPRGSALLEPTLWKRFARRGARSLEFVGGNPDESIPAVLAFLRSAPRDWRLPVVWNSHAYASAEALRLLDGIVDSYVPDFKFGSDECGKRIAGIEGYPDFASAAISHMLDQGVPVFVRILLLPGHVTCCHLPTLARLAVMRRSGLFVSLRRQFSPDWQIQAGDPLARRPRIDEFAEVEHAVRAAGLEIIT
jgi:putative pyruvate formate lyase activating enzyme